MKPIYFLFLLLLLSCQTQPRYKLNILQDGVIDTAFVNRIDEPGRMLLGWYLFAYGNECNTDIKPKCQILNALSIDNECDTSYLAPLKQWFEKDVYRLIKLKNCPSLPNKGAIQNEFKKIILKRNQDTLSIDFRVDGMNNAQEKSWNVEQEDRFLIVGQHLKLL